MRQYLSSRLVIVALVLTIVTLITGVTWAANSSAPGSRTSDQLNSSVVEIVSIPLQVKVGGSLQIAGAGFAANEFVLFEIVFSEDVPNIILDGGVANSAGAFLADATKTFGGALPAAIIPGIYTVIATTIDGHVASTPLVVTEAK